jgi:hypothetical protein
VRGKTIILVAMLIFLVYSSSIVYVQAQYPGYDKPYNPLIGGIQIQISTYGGMTGSFCSLAFPVKFKEGTQTKDGFITAGHCIRIEEGRNYVHQPNISSDFWWNNLIGIGIRNAYPYGGGITDLDGALIRIYEVCERFGCYPARLTEAKIFENGIYYPGDSEDYNNKVGILGYLRLYKGWENNTIIYKSGRTTGLTYGLLTRVYAKIAHPNNVIIDPVLQISRCPNNLCYYNSPIADGGDSGGVAYFRVPGYLHPAPAGHEYMAWVVGISSAVSEDRVFLYASWAVKVKERWPDVELVTCGPRSDSPSCW